MSTIYQKPQAGDTPIVANGNLMRRLWLAGIAGQDWRSRRGPKWRRGMNHAGMCR
jgi:hypothetical protein